jgi:RNA polymerase sigma factor (TIGR02999 family)
MRSILVDFARKKSAEKRGGTARRVALEDGDHVSDYDPFEVLAVHEALEKLKLEDAEMSRLVELRFFCGLSMEETARLLGMSPRSAYSVWALARAWLFREISP